MSTAKDPAFARDDFLCAATLIHLERGDGLAVSKTVIARRLECDAARRRGAFLRALPRIRPASSKQSPLDTLVNKEVVDRIESRLRSHTRLHRTFRMLVAGCTQKQIAEHEKVAPGTVTRRIDRIRGMCKDLT